MFRGEKLFYGLVSFLPSFFLEKRRLSPLVLHVSHLEDHSHPTPTKKLFLWRLICRSRSTTLTSLIRYPSKASIPMMNTTSKVLITRSFLCEYFHIYWIWPSWWTEKRLPLCLALCWFPLKKDCERGFSCVVREGAAVSFILSTQMDKDLCIHLPLHTTTMK